jgi:hypothetical protein
MVGFAGIRSQLHPWRWYVARNWLLDQNVVDDNTFRPPKALALYATNLDNPPRTFEIFRYHDSATRQILKHLGVDQLTPTRSEIDAMDLGNGRWCADKLWELPPPRTKIRKSCGYVFRIDNGTISPAVYSTKKARATVRRGTHIGAGVKLPHFTTAEGRFERCVELEVQWAVDPDMSVSVLTGTELADHVMGVVRDAIDPEAGSDVVSQAPNLQEQLGALYTPPPLWRLSPPSSLHGEERQTTIDPVDLVDASQVGTGYFAFRLSDDESTDNDEISPIFSLQVTETDGVLNLAVVTDFDEMELRLREIA